MRFLANSVLGPTNFILPTPPHARDSMGRRRERIRDELIKSVLLTLPFPVPERWVVLVDTGSETGGETKRSFGTHTHGRRVQVENLVYTLGQSPGTPTEG